ncbi:hypothetical protein GCM10022198_22410 [Klugiella xanthotipulae]|uniref:Uncharacterized membrane protein YgaE (UPF0421/DUF939 family) n=1 Tax=Klugiella xanthotipulae TaxID=244735 RepID=A0A543HYE8_9MICO|nr:FUSC family protein [Klugiella xanthotipulae]TQM63361.1 uncharacterized membrane protein YgaE (UPF0421/DUF939 family) [Klugiella xanthotipulae]
MRWTQRLRRRVDVRAGAGRVLHSAPAIAQITVAAIISYLIAHHLLGHKNPVVALVVTISSLGLQRDARPRLLAETALGMVMGIALSELGLILWGQGTLQLACVLVVVFVAGRFFSPSNSFAVVAAIQASMVQVLPLPDGGPFTRSLDGLVAGLVALLFTAFIPRDPRRGPRRAAKKLFNEWNAALSALAAGLNLGDHHSAERALTRLRATQPLLDDWAESLESAEALARISPFAHRHRDDLFDLAEMLRYMDLATRSLRVIARRAMYKLQDDVPRPRLGQLIVSLSSGVSLLGGSVVDREFRMTARESLEQVVPRLDPQRSGVQDSLGDVGIVLSLRPLTVDLLCAAGVTPEDARTLLPPLD